MLKKASDTCLCFRHSYGAWVFGEQPIDSDESIIKLLIEQELQGSSEGRSAQCCMACTNRESLCQLHQAITSGRLHKKGIVKHVRQLFAGQIAIHGSMQP